MEEKPTNRQDTNKELKCFRCNKIGHAVKNCRMEKLKYNKNNKKIAECVVKTNE
jgi:hypothetical protein